jgi:sterol desaturase/sphingolipid hydroxylase (fatty acid hydroxylase superfamily)
MNAFLLFFEQMPVWQKLGWVIFCIAVFWLLEGYYRDVNNPYDKAGHAKTNFGLLSIVMVINVVFGVLTAGVFIWLNQSNFGLLNYFTAPVWVELTLSIMVLDLIAQYGVHYLLHKVPWMWRLHMVHHSDKHVDVTTGTRHHPFDFVLREVFALIAVVIMGMPVSFYLFYRILSVLFTYWTHANIALPLSVDKALSYLIVTPGVHKFHHHRSMPWTDKNFGNILSVWDRLFGTFVYGDRKEIVFGVDRADHLNDQSFLTQLGLPFSSKVKPLSQDKHTEG